LRQLLNRRTPDETLRLAFYLLLGMLLVALISRLW